MSEPLSHDRLAEIRERADSATPGPWGVGNSTEIALDAVQTSPGCFSYTVKLASVVEDDDRQDDVYYLNAVTQPRPVASAEDDALFIAHSRQDVDDLLAEVDRRLPIEDVERFLKRERDEYEPRGECWNTVDDVLDCFRLHMVTGTPLTEPRPEEGPSDASTGTPPLTEAEELRAEVERLKAELADLEGQNTLTESHFSSHVADSIREQGQLRKRLEAAEAVMRQALAEVEHEEVVYLLNRYLAAAEAVSG